MEMKDSTNDGEEVARGGAERAEGQQPHRAAEAGEMGRRIAEARNGSDAARGELWEGCRNYLLMIANLAVKGGLQSKVGGSDLVQETLLEADRIFDRFDGHSQEELRRWLTRILEHKICNTLKRFCRTGRRDIRRELAGNDGLGADVRNLSAGRGNTPQRQLERDEVHERLQGQIAVLSEDHRQVVRMRIEDGLAFEEIGSRIGRSAEAARKLFARAVLELQRRLKETESGESR
jgi:RNA polymerase sigma-70 factor (ECF subfamily)